uniref:Cyclin-dependent kinases regulatory subunit n=1 Tax=Syphacia muris TaxID=451379 RepID=A0A0N5AGC7_9BILA
MSAVGDNGFVYSEKYCDDQYEYRHVHLTQDAVKKIPTTKLMSESQWRRIGVEQSHGWEHYMYHSPEKHILLFRRPLKKKE